MVGLLLNWVKDWWQSRSRLRLRARNSTALGEVRVPTPNGNFSRFFYAVDLSILNDSTRLYEIDRVELMTHENGLKCAELKQRAHSPPGILSPWGKSTSQAFTWTEKNVWAKGPFKVGPRDSVARKLIIEAPRAAAGVKLDVRALGTDGKPWLCKDEFTLP